MTSYRLLCGWHKFDTTTLPALRTLYRYEDRWPGRATGWLLEPGGVWPPVLKDTGAELLARLARHTGATFTACAFQAYRDGTGCGWHTDRDWGAQAVLSLGVTRSFAVRKTGGAVEDHIRMAHGDLLYMPPGFQDEWEHCVPEEDVPGERCSLVFRN